MTRQEFIDWAISKGYKLSPRSQKNALLEKEFAGIKYRWKVQKISVRKERQLRSTYITHAKTVENRWLLIRSQYLKYLSISDNNELKGLNYEKTIKERKTKETTSKSAS